MTYPRLLNLSASVKERLRSYLDDELLKHDAERSGMQDELIRWQRDYWADPATEKATFPFDGAATITIPLTAIAVETVHARVMQTLFAMPQFASAKPVSQNWQNVSRAYERYFDLELKNSVNIERVLENCSLENIKFGTTVGKAGYERVIKYAIQEIDGQEYEVPVVIKQGACADAVSLAHFLMPFQYQDPQTAPWVGEQHSGSPYQIMQMAQSGLLESDAFDRLEKWVNASQVGSKGERRYDNDVAEQQDMKPVWPRYIDWVEIWLSFDIDESGREKEIVVYYHRASGEFLGVRYNWHSDLHRPYRIGVYFPLEHRWRGIGVCKQNEQFSAEVTTQHRQRLDNATMANMRMIKISKLSNYGPDEPIYPGKMWFVDSKDDIDVMQMGEVYPSAYNNESAAVQYSQQRTGVNEVVLGQPQVGTPGTATSDLARIQEGQKKFDYIYNNFRKFTNQLLTDIACNMHQFGPRYVKFFDQGEDGKLAEQALTIPTDDIRQGVIFDIKSTGQQQNKIIDRQNWTQIAPLYQQYITAMMQLAMPMGDKNLILEIFQRGLTGGTEIMKQLLETYDVRDIERLLITSLTNLNGASGATNPGGNSGIINPAQVGGMGGIQPPVIQTPAGSVQ